MTPPLPYNAKEIVKPKKFFYSEVTSQPQKIGYVEGHYNFFYSEWTNPTQMAASTEKSLKYLGLFVCYLNVKSVCLN